MLGKAYDWLCENWYLHVLPSLGSIVGLVGLFKDDGTKVGIGALVLGWACWNQILSDREGGRDGG